VTRARSVAPFAALAAASLLTLGIPAHAQPAAATPSAGLNFDFATLARSKAGAWAEYAMTRGAATETPVLVRYSLIERTPTKIGFEVDTQTTKGDFLMRLDFAPLGADAWKLAAGKMQMATQKMDMTAAQIEQAAPVKTSEPPGELVGAETVATPGGTFPCKHYKKTPSADGKGPTLELWISDKVAPTGLVKSTLSGTGIAMTLASSGTGAQTKLR
jgi:hypothetical protein